MTPLVRIAGVHKYFTRGSEQIDVLNDLSLEVGAGEFLGLMGPSGSGKTTLLSLIGCMTRPTSGSINVEGRDISHLPERFLTDFRRKTFGFIFQQFHLIKGMNVLQNVMMPLYPTDIKLSDLEAKAEEWSRTLHPSAPLKKAEMILRYRALAELIKSRASLGALPPSEKPRPALRASTPPAS